LGRARKEGVTDLGAQLNGRVAALRLDSDGRIVDATEDAALMLGMKPGEMRGLTLGDLAADQWRAMADGATARILCGDNRIFQLLLQDRSGRRLLVQMASRQDKQDETSSYVLEWSEHFSRSIPTPADADMAELRRLANGLLRAQEAERTRVAVKLDNGVAPLVVIAKFMIEDSLQRIGGAANAESVDLLASASGRLRQALGELQGISTSLRPRMLDDLGLVSTIGWYCRKFEQANRAIRIQQQLSVSEAEVPSQLKLVIFRLVEEALINVAQHANASEAQVILLRVADELLLWVQDNGYGFDAAMAGPASYPLRGIGLPSIRKRIEATGGRLTLQSSKNGGTRIGATWVLPPQVQASKAATV
jgi:signal transduction histidine kinase